MMLQDVDGAIQPHRAILERLEGFGEALDDDRTLASCEIRDGATLILFDVEYFADAIEWLRDTTGADAAVCERALQRAKGDVSRVVYMSVTHHTRGYLMRHLHQLGLKPAMKAIETLETRFFFRQTRDVRGE